MIGFGLSLWGFLICVSAALVDQPTSGVLTLTGLTIAASGAVISTVGLVRTERRRTRIRARVAAGHGQKSNVCLNFDCCPGDVTGAR